MGIRRRTALQREIYFKNTGSSNCHKYTRHVAVSEVLLDIFNPQKIDNYPHLFFATTMAHPQDWEMRRLISIHHWSHYGSEKKSITDSDLQRAKLNYEAWRASIRAPPEDRILGIEFELNAPRDEEYLRLWIIAYNARIADEVRIEQERLVWEQAIWQEQYNNEKSKWEARNEDGDSVSSELEELDTLDTDTLAEGMLSMALDY